MQQPAAELPSDPSSEYNHLSQNYGDSRSAVGHTLVRDFSKRKTDNTGVIVSRSNSRRVN